MNNSKLPALCKIQISPEGPAQVVYHSIRYRQTPCHCFTNIKTEPADMCKFLEAISLYSWWVWSEKLKTFSLLPEEYHEPGQTCRRYCGPT